jgi:hypothetical protein
MPLENPLDMPELRSLIVSSLESKDLASCVRVSKHWRDLLFHPHLWRAIEAGARRGPPIDDIYNHRHLIHTLVLHGVLIRLDKENYTNLRTLSINSPHVSGQSTISLNLIRFPSLVNLALSDVDLAPIIWTTLSSHPHPITLELYTVHIKDVDAPIFWHACQNLEYLRLANVTIKHGALLADTLFNRMRYLHMGIIRGFDDLVRMDLMLRCPRLEYVSWIHDPEDINQRTFHPVQNNHWLRLSKLHIVYPLQDTDMAAILKGVGNDFGTVVYLNANGKALKEQAFRALSRHFNTLTYLSLTECQPDVSWAIRDVLCGCPNLEYLKATSISDRDIAEGGPWVCTRLRELDICFLVEESGQGRQPLIFEHLSTLVRLERLTLQPSPMTDGDQGRVLAFRLSCGMGKLSTLKQLSYICFESGTRYMYNEGVGIKEIKWMIKHWKKMKKVRGRLADHNLYIDICITLEFHGIDYHPATWR